MHDYRYNPFLNALEPVAITGESHVIPTNSPFTIRLAEVPLKESPSTVSLTIAGIAGVEVAAEPAAGEFRCDYTTGADQDDNWNTGLIQFNAADAGKTVVAAYSGIGTLASVNAGRNYPAWFYDRGDGSDGVFNPASNVTISGTKNYTSVNIPVGVTVTVSKTLKIKCKGNVIIAGIINANGQGAPGAPSSSIIVVGTAGHKAGAGGAGGGGAAGGAGGASYLAYPSVAATADAIASSAYDDDVHAGGGGGGGYPTVDDNGGAGGNGGGSVTIVAGYITITGSISAKGTNGSSGTIPSVDGGGGGGGGGGIVLIAKVISNAGTLSVAGGVGGTGKNNNAVTGGTGLLFTKDLGV